jgi:hypothetical protein
MTGENPRHTLGEIAKEEIRKIIEKAETSTCDDICYLQDYISKLPINPEQASALLKNTMILHLDSGLCEDPDGHSLARRILYSDRDLKELLDKM